MQRPGANFFWQCPFKSFPENLVISYQIFFHLSWRSISSSNFKEIHAVVSFLNIKNPIFFWFVLQKLFHNLDLSIITFEKFFKQKAFDYLEYIFSYHAHIYLIFQYHYPKIFANYHPFFKTLPKFSIRPIIKNSGLEFPSVFSHTWFGSLSEDLTVPSP